MSFFRRRSAVPAGEPDPNILTFWQWWHDTGRAAAESALLGGDLDAFTHELSARLEPVGELGGRIVPGDDSAHVLIVTGQGDPASRPIARRLLIAAPPADQSWSYTDVAPAHPDPDSLVISVEDGMLDLARVQVSARVKGAAFDIQVHHPAFADISADSRARVTAELLAATLGEADAALWLGEVQPLEFPPLDGFGLTALRSVVGDLKRKHLDPSGEPRWVMMRGETPEGVLVAVVRAPLHPLTAPHLDTYVSVTLPYERSEGGLPSEATQASLQKWQDRLEKDIAASGKVVGHLSHAGSRTVHLYLDSTAGLVPTVKKHAHAWGEGSESVHEMHDPDWHAIAHLRG